VNNMLGLKRGTVILQPHDEKWHILFGDERSQILSAIGDFVLGIEHVGSTSICGISAKPILDIMVAISKYDDGEKCIAGLEALGYEYKGENGVAGRHFFGKGVPRTHHLHMVELKGNLWACHLAFRDFLNSDKSMALEYDRLKRNLARNFPNDRESYTNGKCSFVEKVLNKSGYRNNEG
jgi:GrpB-like predicted nucleotidyltransferase (UPF0157 family)